MFKESNSSSRGGFFKHKSSLPPNFQLILRGERRVFQVAKTHANTFEIVRKDISSIFESNWQWVSTACSLPARKMFKESNSATSLMASWHTIFSWYHVLTCSKVNACIFKPRDLQVLRGQIWYPFLQICWYVNDFFTPSGNLLPLSMRSGSELALSK